MNITTKIIIIGAASLPVACLVGIGLGAVSMIIDDEVKKHKKAASKSAPGPAPEKIKTPWIRNEVHKQFNDIIDKY